MLKNGAKQILDLGKQVLPTEDYSKAYALAKMNILLRKNKTKELIGTYHRTKFNRIEFKTNAIPPLLRAFYQDMKDDAEFAESQIRNFKDFLKRHSSYLNKKKIVGQNNFLVIFKLMVQKTERHLIRAKLDGMNSVFYRSWIEDQLQKEERTTLNYPSFIFKFSSQNKTYSLNLSNCSITQVL